VKAKDVSLKPSVIPCTLFPSALSQATQSLCRQKIFRKSAFRKIFKDTEICVSKVLWDTAAFGFGFFIPSLGNVSIASVCQWIEPKIDSKEEEKAASRARQMNMSSCWV
jgi:hypothetical protein